MIHFSKQVRQVELYKQNRYNLCAGHLQVIDESYEQHTLKKTKNNGIF